MKNASKSNGVRWVQQLFYTLSLMILIAILVWVWDRTPKITIQLPSQQWPHVGRSQENHPDQLSPTGNSSPPNPWNATSIIAPATNKQQEEQVLGSVPPDSNEQQQEPVAPNSNASLAPPDSDSDSDSNKDEIECNYAVGKWVPDNDTRPIYSGVQCKKWLSPMANCRLMARTDFSYEGFRWQPDNCDIPKFDNEVFLNRMKDKTIVFMGDSLGRQQYQSLLCMATGGSRLDSDVQDVGEEYGLVKPRHAFKPGGSAYRFGRTNTTILFYWSVSLCELEALNSSDPENGYFAMHLDRPEKFLTRYLHKIDVLVLNTKHHWSRAKLDRNKWFMYMNGSPVKIKKLSVSNARDIAVTNVVNWLDSQLWQHPGLKVFFRTLSPRHFANGDWDTGGRCDSTTPLESGNQIFPWNASDDSPVVDAVKGTGVKLLDVTGFSKLRDEAHVSRFRSKIVVKYDCLHWCLPGIPDEWNKILYAQI